MVTFRRGARGASQGLRAGLAPFTPIGNAYFARGASQRLRAGLAPFTPIGNAYFARGARGASQRLGVRTPASHRSHPLARAPASPPSHPLGTHIFPGVRAKGCEPGDAGVGRRLDGWHGSVGSDLVARLGGGSCGCFNHPSVRIEPLKIFNIYKIIIHVYVSICKMGGYIGKQGAAAPLFIYLFI